MLEPNISEQNGFLRVICGVTTSGLGIARLSRVPTCKVGHLMLLFGALKVAEGLYQYCPLVALFGEEKDSQ